MENYNGITRRNFLIGTVAAGAATGLSGCMIGPEMSKEMQDYLDSNDFQAYAIVVSQRPNEKARVRGWNKGEHLALEGTIEQHSRRLDMPLEALLRKAKKTGSNFGYATRTDLEAVNQQIEVKDKSFELPRESWMTLAHYFPEGALSNTLDERLTKRTYESMIHSGELRVVRIAYIATPKPAKK